MYGLENLNDEKRRLTLRYKKVWNISVEKATVYITHETESSYTFPIIWKIRKVAASGISGISSFGICSHRYPSLAHRRFTLSPWRDAILIILANRRDCHRSTAILSFVSFQMTGVIGPLERPCCFLAECTSLIASQNAILRDVRIDSRRRRRKIAPGMAPRLPVFSARCVAQLRPFERVTARRNPYVLQRQRCTLRRVGKSCGIRRVVKRNGIHIAVFMLIGSRTMKLGNLRVNKRDGISICLTDILLLLFATYEARCFNGKPQQPSIAFKSSEFYT